MCFVLEVDDGFDAFIIVVLGGVSGVPNNLAVDSAGDAVLQLQVHLRDGVVGEDGGVRDITCKVEKRTSQSGVVFQGCVEFRSLVRRAVCIGSFCSSPCRIPVEFISLRFIAYTCM